MICLELSRC